MGVKTRYDKMCICGKVYETFELHERKKKYPGLCQSCAFKQEWNNPERRKKNVDALRAAHSTPEAKKRHGKATRRNLNIPGFYEKTLGLAHTPEANKKRGATLARKWAEDIKYADMMTRSFHGRYQGKYVSDPRGRRRYMRSSYETRVAAEFDKRGVDWYFEEQRVFLNDINKTYVPDFYVPSLDTHIEVKGYLRDDALKKWMLFKVLYPNSVMFFKQDIARLEQGDELETIIKEAGRREVCI